jgi:hypothetical protein
MNYNKENAAMFFNNILDYGSEDLKEQLTELFLDGLRLYREENKELIIEKYTYVNVLDVLKYVLDHGKDKVMLSIREDNSLLDFFVINKSK